MRVTRDGDVFVVVGDIDASNSPSLAAALRPLGVGHDVVVDVAGVEFIDSRGLGVLMDAHRRAADGGRALVLRNPSPAVSRLLELVGLDALFQIETGG
jgi:anti-sigma B factor antagonist